MSGGIDFGAVMTRLAATIRARKGDDQNASYTAKLIAEGREKCAKKFGEEAVEAAIAGALGDRAALTAEAADVLYHLSVLLEANEVALEDVAQELARREGVSGIVEKANRKT